MNICSAFLIYIYLCVFLLTHWEITSISETLGEKDASTMLVIAHPDDETMFFGPLFINLVSLKRDKVFLLCLTSGGYYGLGDVRRLELLEASQEIGLPVKNVLIVDHFTDGFDQAWNLTMVAMIVLEKIVQNNISEVFTFDEYGISGHPNHKDTHTSIAVLMSSFNSDSSVKFMTLESVNIFRKYLSFLEVPISLLDWCLNEYILKAYKSIEKTKKWFIGVKPLNYMKLIRSLYRHQSQMAWFRRIYSLFSRYMFINTIICL